MAVAAASTSGRGDRAVMTEFIEKYQNSECLWRVNEKNYKNKNQRQKALEELLAILKKIDNSANIDSVTKKINNIRSAFSKENNKVKAANRSGMGADEEYVPKLWYYNLLLFLNEKDSQVEQSADINEILLSEENENNNEDMDINTDQASQFSAARSEPPPRCDSSSNPRKKVCEVLNKISNNLDMSKTKPTFSAFGEHVAEKLRNMLSDSAKYCQKIINDAIFYAEFDRLNDTSRIVTDQIASSPYYRYQTPSSTQSPSPYHSTNEQINRPYRPPSSTLTPSPYQSPTEQTDRPHRPPSSRLTPSPYQSTNEQTDIPHRPPSSTQILLPYPAQNEGTAVPRRPSSSSQIHAPYPTPNKQTARPHRPLSSSESHPPYPTLNKQTARPHRPSSSSKTRHLVFPPKEMGRPFRPSSSTVTQPSFHSPNELMDRPVSSEPTLIELPSEPLEQPHQQSSTETMIFDNDSEFVEVEYLDQDQDDD